MQLSINLVANIAAFTINLAITFFLTPYITNSLGVEAYGFVALGTNLINFAALATTALNSMASRFISMEIHYGNWENANKYFNSVLISNVVLSGVFLFPLSVAIFYIDKIIYIPPNIVNDVKGLFAFLFLSFFFSLIATPFTVSTFVTNKLHLKALREIESIALKALFLVGSFSLFSPTIFFVGFANLISVIYTGFFNVLYTKKFLKKITINKKFFELKSVKELTSSGVWNTLIQVGNLMLQGFDLILANIFLGPKAMGTLAIAKTVPTAILSLVGVIANVFMPDFTRLYANGKHEELLSSIKKSMKILGTISVIPIAILVSFGEEFFALWIPTQDPKLLQILSIITIAMIVFSGSINSLYGIFTVTNKLKTNALVLLITGILNLLLVIVMLIWTNWGLYAIAATSTILSIIRNLMFTAPFGAKYLNQKWYIFFPEIIKGVISFVIVVGIGLSLNQFNDINDWFSLIFYSVLTAIIGLLITSYINYKF